MRRVTTTTASGTPSGRLADTPRLRAEPYSASAENAIPRINVTARERTMWAIMMDLLVYLHDCQQPARGNIPAAITWAQRHDGQ